MTQRSDLNEVGVPIERPFIDQLAIHSIWPVLQHVTGLIAQAAALIGIVTDIACYGRFSPAFVSPVAAN